MIVVIVKAKILPDKKDELRKVANILQFDYAPSEKGCIRYESFIDADNFITIEIWESKDLLDIHLAQEHVKKYVPAMKECLVKGLLEVTLIHEDKMSQIEL